MEQIAHRDCTVSILGGFQDSPDIALSNLVWSHNWVLSEQEVGLETSWGPFQYEFSCDSVSFLMASDQMDIKTYSRFYINNYE